MNITNIASKMDSSWIKKISNSPNRYWLLSLIFSAIAIFLPISWFVSPTQLFVINLMGYAYLAGAGGFAIGAIIALFSGIGSPIILISGAVMMGSFATGVGMYSMIAGGLTLYHWAITALCGISIIFFIYACYRETRIFNSIKNYIKRK